jgi:hypothetical protein
VTRVQRRGSFPRADHACHPWWTLGISRSVHPSISGVVRAVVVVAALVTSLYLPLWAEWAMIGLLALCLLLYSAALADEVA